VARAVDEHQRGRDDAQGQGAQDSLAGAAGPADGRGTERAEVPEVDGTGPVIRVTDPGATPKTWEKTSAVPTNAWARPDDVRRQAKGKP
jgi:hypothetical protein